MPLEQDALDFHQYKRPGKLEIVASKPLISKRDLSLAYSPGVAVPCLKIQENPDDDYLYTSKGNLVAVISNGTAVLGLGNIGARASKPVMEGKSVLFKKFADVDSIDIEVDTTNSDEFIRTVELISSGFGGINLEDIKAPECFYIERELQKRLKIPVFHDDQHGTAIIAVAGLINALDLTGRKVSDVRIVVNGAGAASIACVNLIVKMGVPSENIIVCDSKGVIYKGRTEGMNEYKEPLACDTKLRTLEEAMKGADVFWGLSVKGAVNQEMVKSMADKPIIFAMANPDPEIVPEAVNSVRPDAIIATGRSDYPNQVNNVLGFPYIFRGALDARASQINDEMKIACAKAISDLTRESVPDEVSRLLGVNNVSFSRNYIIPSPFDPRLATCIPEAVAKAAIESGVSGLKKEQLKDYTIELKNRFDNTASLLHFVNQKIENSHKKVLFCEGEELRILKAASHLVSNNIAKVQLIGMKETIIKSVEEQNLKLDLDKVEIIDLYTKVGKEQYAEHLYEQTWRYGNLKRDSERSILSNRNVLGASMLDMGHSDILISGLTRSFTTSYHDIYDELKLQHRQNTTNTGVSMIFSKNHLHFISDVAVNGKPDSIKLADIAEETASFVSDLGIKPRVALLSYSSFGSSVSRESIRVRKAVEELEKRNVDFEFDGEMTVNIALNYNAVKELFPNCRLTGPANVLIMPDLESAHISSRMMRELANTTLIGPILLNYPKQFQILRMGMSVSEIINTVMFAIHETVR